MKLTITHWDGKTIFYVEVEQTEYVEDLKAIIQEKYDIPVDQQRLSHRGDEIDDTATIEDLYLTEGDSLVLEPMKVTVILPDNVKRIRLTLVPTDNIKKIKKAVFKKAGIKPEYQCVIFNQNELHDGQTIADSNIEHGDAVVVQQFTLNICHWDGDIFQVTPSPRDTVEVIKKIIMEKTGVEKEKQKFVFKENPVNEFVSFKAQQIKNKSLLEMQKPCKPKKEAVKLSFFPDPKPAIMADDSPRVVSLSIRLFNGTTFKMEVDTNNFIDDLKPLIEEQHGISPDQQRISFDGTLIDETETLADQGIEEGAVLVLEPMKIFILLPNGKKIRFSVNIDDTIKRIKRVVTKKSGIPAAVQVVKFNDMEVADSKTLSSLSVVHEDTLIVETFRITVVDWEGETIEFKEISPKDTLEEIKTFLNKEKGYHFNKQVFKYAGTKLNSFVPIGDQGVSNMSILEMEKPKEEVRPQKKVSLQIFGALDEDPLKRSTHCDDHICVTIQKSKTETFPLYFDAMGYIADLKIKIEDAQDIKVTDQRLSLDGAILEDDLTLVECKISNGTTLVLEPMRVVCVLPNKKKMRLTVSLDDTIKKLKNAVFKKTKISMDVQCIMFGGKELRDMDRIESSGISHEDEIMVELYSIKIAHWLGDIFILTDLNPSDNLEDLKSILQKRKQIPKEMQQFTIEGRPVNGFISL
ncbi:ubiquitin [Nitzschia inconspicua]|uniref:Ubiquitin n=1 Tax=Nitzschia inconspicua TaxID=303405 RepID=A0A9K3L2D1_9STRA|nr:ubiquitin [Nitzschia inconspicua]